ncbi:glycoside hydrolase family 35 protein [Enterococcus sp. LJL120]
MRTFEIKEDFLLDGQPIKLISGAIHYFRMTPGQWEDSLYNLKALGANTVETYIPWNLHEPLEGQFDFSGLKDVTAFIKLAQKMDLLVILRPSAYICAEWDFGGLPPWLLNFPGIRLRSTDGIFMEKVSNYFAVLLPKLAPLQISEGGPVIMMQIENEYGSYGMEKDYLRETKKIMVDNGITVPLFTADGDWPEVLDAGSLIEEDVFVTGNFGSHAQENAAKIQQFMAKHGKKWPVMCMEFWDGWFNLWGNEIIRRQPAEVAAEVKAMLTVGSINFYMFHGGTNFGFYNGCSVNQGTDFPQVTSYDYDALLTEWGTPTEKYFAVQKAIKEICPNVWQAEPRSKTFTNFGSFPVKDSVSLFNTIAEMSTEQRSVYPLTMEAAGSGLGYILYSADLKNYQQENRLQLVEASDRGQIFINNQFHSTQYHETMGAEIRYHDKQQKESTNVKILLENLGRVNYGYKLNAPTQQKGLRGGLIHDIHFHQGFTQYALDFSFEQLAKIDFTAAADYRQPSFYKFEVELAEPRDSFIDCSHYGKGIVAINGFNLGRYWQLGPTQYLYCPKEFLQQGLNQIIIFETEGVKIDTLSFSDQPVYGKD